MAKDYRKGQKVIATIEIEDRGQDFIEIDVLKNGVILGNSIMFSNGIMSLLGIGTLDGMTYHSFLDFKIMKTWSKLKNLFIYVKNTGEKDPLPWNASTLNYKVIKVKKAIKPNRFIK